MKGTIRELAGRSGKGRRRENGVLFVALFFLFFFIGAGISWFSISRKTEEQGKLDTYGAWKAAFYEADAERVKAFTENPATKQAGVCKVVGTLMRPDAAEEIAWLEEEEARYVKETGEKEGSFMETAKRVLGFWSDEEVKNYFEMFGTIGTIDEGTREMGRISMVEGRFPENVYEVAMTEGQLLRMGYEARLGQEITLCVYGGDGQAERKNYRLCGIINSYGGNWNTKGFSPVSVVINDKGAGEYPWEPSYHVFTDIDGDAADTIQVYHMSEETMETIRHFAFNSYAYGFRSIKDYSYLFRMLLIVFLLAVLLVTQILSTQMKKRSRQVGLMKAIGATDRQIQALFLWEFTSVLWKALLSGLLLGGALVPAVLWGSGIAKVRHMRYDIDILLLAGSLGIGLLVAYLGAWFPIQKGKRIPIRGEIAVKVHKIRPLKAKRRYSKGRLVGGRGGGSFRAGVVLLLILLICTILLPLYHGTFVMAPYRNGEKALYYEITTNVSDAFLWEEGMNDTLLKQIEEIPGVEAVYTRKNEVPGNDGGLSVSYEGIENCELERIRKRYSDGPYGKGFDIQAKPWRKAEDQAMVSTVGIYTGWEGNLEGLSDLVTEGALDRQAFTEGKEVLLFLPPYRTGIVADRYQVIFQASPAYRKFYEEEESIKAGDTMTLRIAYREPEMDENGNAIEAEPAYEEIRELPVTVGGIIRYLPQNTRNPLWNLNNWETKDDLTSCTVIMSSGLVNEITEIYSGIARDDFYLSQLSQTSPFDGITVLCSNHATEATEENIKNIAGLYGLSCHLNGDIEGATFAGWKAGYDDALDSAMLDAVIAITGAFAVIFLLFQFVTARLEEDRKHIGIFQALGIRRKEIAWFYIRRGLENGVFSLIAGNGLLVPMIWLTNRAVLETVPSYWFSGREERLVYQLEFWLGNCRWGLHITICAVFLVVNVVLYLLPLRGVLRNSPVENIRELGE